MCRVFYLLFVTLIFFVSCKKESKYAGYSEHKNGIYFKLLAFKDSNRKPVEGDHLELRIVYKTMNDSVLMSTKKINGTTTLVAFKKDSLTGLFYNILSELTEGDSVSYILTAEIANELLPAVPEMDNYHGPEIKLDISLASILNPVEYKQWLADMRHKKDNQDMEERRSLQVYLHKEFVDETPVGSGFYYISLKEGEGPAIENGKNVEVFYKGCFLDGTPFDSTKTGEFFNFTIGEEYQLIKGLEEGICLMKEGGKAKFIIPSQLAFGDKGSSTGIVPPYTTVVYEVQILKVN